MDSRENSNIYMQVNNTLNGRRDENSHFIYPLLLFTVQLLRSIEYYTDDQQSLSLSLSLSLLGDKTQHQALKGETSLTLNSTLHIENLTRNEEIWVKQ